MAKTNIGKLRELNETISKNEINKASSLVKDIVIQNGIEQNLKEVLSIIISQKKDNLLGNTDIKKLQTIAKLCPYESGPAVYNARVLLSGLDNTTYINVCEMPIPATGNSRVSRETITESAYEGSDEVFIYPNPTNDRLNISLHLNQTETGVFTIFDLTGKLILSSPLSSSSVLSEVSTVSLSEGMYIYKLSVNNIQIKSGKLTIIR